MSYDRTQQQTAKKNEDYKETISVGGGPVQ